MTPRPLSLTAAAALLAMVSAAPALAQTGTTPEASPEAAPPPMQAPAETPAARLMMAHVEQHIADLHRRLQITQAEEPQWKAFAQVMRENAEHMDQAVDEARRRQGANVNALEDLQTYAAIAEAHAQDVQRLVPAFQALYEAMPPQQRRVADQVFRSFERRREMRRQAD